MTYDVNATNLPCARQSLSELTEMLPSAPGYARALWLLWSHLSAFSLVENAPLADTQEAIGMAIAGHNLSAVYGPVANADYAVSRRDWARVLSRLVQNKGVSPLDDNDEDE